MSTIKEVECCVTHFPPSAVSWVTQLLALFITFSRHLLDEAWKLGRMTPFIK